MDDLSERLKNEELISDESAWDSPKPPSPYQTPIVNSISSSSLLTNWENSPNLSHVKLKTDSVYAENGGDESEDGDEDVPATNPEAPMELIMAEELLEADNIGDTVFSKRWVLSTLLNILKYIDDDTTNQLVDLKDDFHDDICKLWDMSMNQDVSLFLFEHQSHSLFIKCIEKSNSCRAKEICIGILGNMFCCKHICQDLSADPNLVSFFISLLQNDDPPVLIEALRLLITCLCYNNLNVTWISCIRNDSCILPCILFILQSSTNADLLKSTSEFISKLFEVDDNTCQRWSSPDLVLAILEAFKQTGSEKSRIYKELISTLHYVSTNKDGVQSLVTYVGEICLLAISYLKDLCDDVLVVVDGNEDVIASNLSVLNVLFMHWDANLDFVNQDYSFLRVLIKLLEAVNKLPYFSNEIDNATNNNGRIDDKMEDIGGGGVSNGHDDPIKIICLIQDLLSTLLTDTLSLILKICSVEKMDDAPNINRPKSLEYMEKSCDEKRLNLIFNNSTEIEAWTIIASDFKCFRLHEFFNKRLRVM